MPFFARFVYDFQTLAVRQGEIDQDSVHAGGSQLRQAGFQSIRPIYRK
jgi:hypothetical protein